MGDYNNPNGENNNQGLNNQNSEPQYQQPGYQEPVYQQPQYQTPQYQEPQYQSTGNSNQQSQYQQYDSGQGQYQQYSQYQQYQQPNKKKGLAIASLVCGIVSLVINCCLWYVSLPVSIVGIILGIISIKNKEDAKPMAIVGIVLCSLAVLLAIILLISCIAIAGNEDFMNSFYREFYNNYSNDFY